MAQLHSSLVTKTICKDGLQAAFENREGVVLSGKLVVVLRPCTRLGRIKQNMAHLIKGIGADISIEPHHAKALRLDIHLVNGLVVHEDGATVIHSLEERISKSLDA